MRWSRYTLILLSAAQFALFWQFSKREILWAYPADFDQSAYLSMDYALYQDVLREGMFPALEKYLHQPHPTGLMLPLQDTLLHFFCGPGRGSNLLLNFLYFVLLEWMVFVTARRLSGRDVFGWIGCGLLTMQQTMFLRAGGLFDCRIDSIAYCLYGIFVCLLVCSSGLRKSGWLMAAVGCAMLMVSFRFITFAYLIGFCMTLFTALLILCVVWRGGRKREKIILAGAMSRTAMLGLGFFMVGGALVALNWRFIHDYYVVGHLTGNEKHIRAAEMGVTNLTAHLTYYFLSLWRDHLGTRFILAGLALIFLGVIGWWRDRRSGALANQPVANKGDWLVRLLIIGASLFSPWFILTLDESKSGLVANVLTTPVTLLVITLMAGFRRRPTVRTIQQVSLAPGRVCWSAAAVTVLVLGAYNWLDHLSREGRFAERKASVEQIGALYDFIGDESTQKGLASPRITTDMVVDWMIPGSLNVSLYERSGRWLNARSIMGAAIFAVTREQIIRNLESSDFVLLTTFPKVGPYPYYDSMREFSGEMVAWCQSHLLETRTFQIDGGEVTVYERPNVSLEGLSGGWITPAGVRLSVPAGVASWMEANGKKVVVLEGAENPVWLPKPPVASARLIGQDGQPSDTACPAEFTLPTVGTYRIRVDVGPAMSKTPGETIEVFLRLDGSYFVPKEVGFNEDTRQLIVNEPTAIRLE